MAVSFLLCALSALLGDGEPVTFSVLRGPVKIEFSDAPIRSASFASQDAPEPLPGPIMPESGPLLGAPAEVVAMPGMEQACSCDRCGRGRRRDQCRLPTPYRPPGNMSPHIPYQAYRTYYYFRPYSPMQLEEQRLEGATMSQLPGLPYSNHIFQDAYESVEQENGLQR